MISSVINVSKLNDAFIENCPRNMDVSIRTA